MTPEFAAAADAMMATPPRDWWRFVACRTCMARRGKPCAMGGDSWPEVARRPHVSRYRVGLELNAIFWLLSNGHAADVLAPPTSGEGRATEETR